MSLAGVRADVHGRRTLRSITFVFAWVVLVVAGLVAMHAVDTGMGLKDPSGMSMSQPAQPDNAATVKMPGHSGIPFADTVTPNTIMLTMTCVLALLLFLLTIGSSKFLRRSFDVEQPFVPIRHALATRAASGKSPPDLTVLSISRI